MLYLRGSAFFKLGMASFRFQGSRLPHGVRRPLEFDGTVGHIMEKIQRK
jgi:hypothetical protein